MVIVNYIIIFVLIVLSGLFSGLTLGLMSLDIYELKRKIELNNKDAKEVYPLRKNGNLLLCTLLLGNVAVNSALAIFLGSITAGILAGTISTGLIVVFGEILPQSVFARHGLKFGAKSAWLVWIFLVTLYPLTKPLSIILDKFLGGELPTIYSKKEFRLIIKEQRKLKKTDLKNHEFNILEGGLDYYNRTVKSIMTPRTNTFFVNSGSLLTKKVLEKIHKKGHSRMPVYSNSKDKIVGILYSKDLIALDPKEKVSVKKIMRKNIHFISENKRLGNVLDMFKNKKVHLFIVRDQFKGVSGIVTLEDVLEEIVREIVDEYDKSKDMRKV